MLTLKEIHVIVLVVQKLDIIYPIKKHDEKGSESKHFA